MRSLNPLVVRICALGILALVAGRSYSETINFGDGTINALSGPVDPTGYLGGFGITVTNVTSGAPLQIQDDRYTYGGGAVTATSGHNFLEQGGGYPVRYELDFSTEVTNLNFNRIAIDAPSSMPTWSASLYNNSILVGTLGENGFIAYNTPAANFSFSGMGNRLVVNGNDFGYAGYQTLLMDDLSFDPVGAPLPTSAVCGIALCGGLFVFRSVRSRVRRQSRTAPFGCESTA
jgi:hypothetical protein